MDIDMTKINSFEEFIEKHQEKLKHPRSHKEKKQWIRDHLHLTAESCCTTGEHVLENLDYYANQMQC